MRGVHDEAGSWRGNEHQSIETLGWLNGSARHFGSEITRAPCDDYEDCGLQLLFCLRKGLSGAGPSNIHIDRDVGGCTGCVVFMRLHLVVCRCR